MRITTIFVSLLVITSAAFLAFGCSKKAQSFGQPITESIVTPIGNILSNPNKFIGKTVKVAGKIVDECPAGGWFFLKDQSGNIYVNLHPSYIAIPQARGHEAVAQGVVKNEYNQLSVIGEGVELK